MKTCDLISHFAGQVELPVNVNDILPVLAQQGGQPISNLSVSISMRRFYREKLRYSTSETAFMQNQSAARISTIIEAIRPTGRGSYAAKSCSTFSIRLALKQIHRRRSPNLRRASDCRSICRIRWLTALRPILTGSQNFAQPRFFCHLPPESSFCQRWPTQS